jgi:protein TonB
MKQFLPVLILLFICSLCPNNHAAAQEPAATKAKVDTVEEVWEKFAYVPQEGEFKGGDSALQKFIEKHLVYPKYAKRKKIEGTVTVQFILDKLGYLADVEAISGPLELRESAISVIKKTYKWDPAIQGGRQVKAYKKYDIVFKLGAASVIRKTPRENKE